MLWCLVVARICLLHNVGRFCEGMNRFTVLPLAFVSLIYRVFRAPYSTMNGNQNTPKTSSCDTKPLVATRLLQQPVSKSQDHGRCLQEGLLETICFAATMYFANGCRGFLLPAMKCCCYPLLYSQLKSNLIPYPRVSKQNTSVQHELCVCNMVICKNKGMRTSIN